MTTLVMRFDLRVPDFASVTHAEQYAATCLSLPMFAELTGDQQAYVAVQ